jgi:Peptidase family M28/PA domain
MKKIILPCMLAFNCMLVYAQQDKLAQKYAATITAEDLKKHLTIIASDEMEGRETGTEGQRKAAIYIENQFRQIGLQTAATLQGYQQLFPLFTDSMTESLVQLGDNNLIYGTDYYIQANKNSNKKFTANEIVFVGYGISTKNYNDYANKDVKGKVVVFFSGEPKQNDLYLATGTKNYSDNTYPGLPTKLATAQANGVAGVIVINQTIKMLSSSMVASNATTNMYFVSVENTDGPSSLIMPTEAAKKYLNSWPIDSLITMAKAYKSFTNPATATVRNITNSFTYSYTKARSIVQASNVIGIIEGSDKKDEYVFLTGHYDHLGKKGNKIYYGADDDGSGTCAVIEMAEAFAKAKAAGHGPRRTVVCMTVSGEEKGLWGSEYYSDHPIYALAKTTADLNTDMVGRKDPNRKTGDNNNYVYVIGHDKLSSDLPIINEGVNNLYTKLEFDYKYDDPNDDERIYYRSDHYNFARKGVPILFFFDGIHEDYHKTTDTVDKINFDLYTKRVQMIFYTAWVIANRNDMLVRDIPLPEGTR